MTVSFWDCIRIEKRGRVYELLANIHMADTGKKLPYPPGMVPDTPDTRPLVTIDTSDYEEENLEDIAREMQKPSHPSKESRK